MTEPIALQVVIPFHQPLNATDADIESAIERCYAPLLAAIGERPEARIAVHFTGHLLDYLAASRHDIIGKLKALFTAGQVEVLGGLYHGGIPAILPEMDVRGQVEMMSGFWESYLGSAPQGFWLPELAWSVELPRLLADSGLSYGFAAASQLAGIPNAGCRLGVIERAEASVGVFPVDERLARGLLASDADAWVEAVADRAGTGVPGVCAYRVITVGVRAESLGLEPGTFERCYDNGWLNQWLDAISGGRPELDPILPGVAFKQARPAAPVSLRCACAGDDIERAEQPIEWATYGRRSPVAGVLFRRMLQVSDKLKEFIAAMEDEELEDDWSDGLATAQRLLFAAQSPDVYWCGRELSSPHQEATPTRQVAGFRDPAVREAAMRRLLRAANILDKLVQGEDDWIGAEEDDRDRDLVDEMVVSTARVTAWFVPAEGGVVRALDNRAGERTLLDVDLERHNPDGMPTAPRQREMAVDATMVDPPAGGSAATAGLRRITAPGAHGITTWVLEGDTQIEEVAGGSAVNLMPGDAAWDVIENGIDEEGDCSYRMTLAAVLDLAGRSPRTIGIEKRLVLPIDTTALELAYDATLTGDADIVVATEIPLRLAGEVKQIVVNGAPRDLAQEELPDATRIRLACQTPDGGEESVELRLSEPTDVWCIPVGNRGRDGILLVPLLRLEDRASLTLTLDIAGCGPAEIDGAEEQAPKGGEDEEPADEETDEDEWEEMTAHPTGVEETDSGDESDES